MEINENILQTHRRHLISPPQIKYYTREKKAEACCCCLRYVKPRRVSAKFFEYQLSACRRRGVIDSREARDRRRSIRDACEIFMLDVRVVQLDRNSDLGEDRRWEVRLVVDTGYK